FIGGTISFSADSLELQHFTNPVTHVVTNNFIFTNASLALLIDGNPMVSVSGDATFHYTTKSNDPTNNPNGFRMDTFTVTGFTFLDPAVTLGPLTLTNYTVSLGHFSFTPNFGALSATLSATVTVSADATIGSKIKFMGATPGTGISGAFTLDATFSLSDLTHPTISPGGFSITANSMEIDIGSFLKIT